jgi:probable H4MPT-linked C1 transfer pathway protein
MSTIIGWDIGGAHLKAARAENGCIVAAVQVPSPLRLGLDRLAQSFAEAKARIGEAERHAVTMTGELADTFANRTEGVEQLTKLASQELGPVPILLYAGRAGFIPTEKARPHVEDIASANWHASASAVARKQRDALFIDIGSTTTDIVPVLDGTVSARGYTDVQRLATGELVYTGLTRTPLMAIASHAPFRGSWTTLVNENFANMADVQRVLGTLPDDADQMPTPDGRPKSAAASQSRLARMVGCDAEAEHVSNWHTLAHWFAELQRRSIIDGAMLVLSASKLSADAPVVGAGIGIKVVREIARRLGRNHVDFDMTINVLPHARDRSVHCAPACAIALLASAGFLELR